MNKYELYKQIANVIILNLTKSSSPYDLEYFLYYASTCIIIACIIFAYAC